MDTPTGPEERGPADSAVQHLLWRLRARLVTPPREQQVSDDLGRLLEAARAQAHVSPSAHASDLPDPDADTTRPQFPLVRPVAASLAGEGTDELAARRSAHGMTRLASRVAAASVAVLVVGVGVSSATNGPITLEVLFGRDVAVAPEEPPLAVDEPDQEPDEVVPDDEPAVDEVEADTAGSESPVGSDTPSEPPVDADADAQVEPAPGPSRSPSTGNSTAPGTSQSLEPAPEPLPTIVIAAPPPPQPPTNDAVDGFGQGQRCDGEDLASCLQDESEEGGPDLEAEEDEPEVDAETLASRRFRAAEPEGDTQD